MTGADGNDIILKVPVGTEILDEEQEVVLADLTVVGQRVRLAAGGNGGWATCDSKPRQTAHHARPIRAKMELPVMSGCS